MKEHEESDFMPSNESQEHSDEQHICTDGHLCTIGHNPDKLENTSSTSEQKEPEKTRCTKKCFIGAGIIILILGALTAFVYTRPSDDTQLKKITRVLPFPAIMVGRSFVTIEQYLSEKEALMKYFATLPKDGTAKLPADAELQKMIVETLVNKLAIKKLASNAGIALDPARVDTYYQDIVKAQPSEEDFKKQLQDTFGWTPEDFKHRIVNSIVLAMQMGEFITSNQTIQQPQRTAIDQARERVMKGEDFATVAKEVHEAQKIKMQSDLGFIKQSELPAAWASQVGDLEKDKISEIIELPEGYAVFKMIDRIKAGEETQLHLMTITVPKVTLQQVVKKYLENVKVKTLIKL